MRVFFVGALVVGAIACGARIPNSAPSPDEPAPLRVCTVVPLDQIPLETPDGMRIYSYPSTVDMDSSGTTLVLHPESTGFEPRSGGGWKPAGQAVLGAMVRSDREVSVVEPPVPAERIRGLRVASRGEARWSVVFAEDTEASGGSGEASTRYWHGTLTPAGWSALEEVPVPVGIDLMLESGSISATSTGVVWAIPYRRRISHGTGRMAVLRRDRDGWTERTLLLPFPSYTALVADQDRLTFALVHPDTTLRADGNSLFLHSIDGGRVGRRKIAASQTGDVHDPVLSRSRDGLLLAWLTSPAPGESASGRRAFVAHDVEDSTVAAGVLVDSSAISIQAISPGDGRVMAVTVSAGALGDRRLRFTEVSGDSVEERVVLEPPFVTDFGMDAVDSTVVVTGGIVLEDRSAVWLELHYLRIRCT